MYYVKSVYTLHYITLHYITLHCITLHYITIHTYMYGQDGGAAGEVRFDLAGPVFYALWDVGGMAEWLTRFVLKTQNPNPNPKP